MTTNRDNIMRELKAYEITHKDGEVSFIAAYDFAQALRISDEIAGCNEEIVSVKLANEDDLVYYRFDFEYAVDLDGVRSYEGLCDLHKNFSEHYPGAYRYPRTMQDFEAEVAKAFDEATAIHNLTVGDLLREAKIPAYLTDKEEFTGGKYEVAYFFEEIEKEESARRKRELADRDPEFAEILKESEAVADAA